jgi:hypothetical protein
MKNFITKIIEKLRFRKALSISFKFKKGLLSLDAVRRYFSQIKLVLQ